MNSTSKHKTWIAIGALTSPFIALSIYFLVSRKGNINREYDYLATGSSLAIGLPFILLMFKTVWSRIAAIVTYFSIGWIILMGYGLLFVCYVFRDCL
jgi:hypothetical protein